MRKIFLFCLLAVAVAVHLTALTLSGDKEQDAINIIDTMGRALALVDAGIYDYRDIDNSGDITFSVHIGEDDYFITADLDGFLAGKINKLDISVMYENKDIATLHAVFEHLTAGFTLSEGTKPKENRYGKDIIVRSWALGKVSYRLSYHESKHTLLISYIK